MTVVESRPAKAGSGSVLGRVFEVLECFRANPRERSVGVIAAETGLPPATVHRILAALVEWGAVDRFEWGRYRLSGRLWRLGNHAPAVRVGRDVVRPYLVDLYAEARAPVVVGCRDGDGVGVVDQLVGSADPVTWPEWEPLLPPCTPWGLMHLAHLPEDEPLRRRRPDVWAALERPLAEVRRTGVAVARPRDEGGLAWIAAPIFGEGAQVRSVLGLAVRDGDIARGADLVTRAAHRATKAIERSRTA